MKWSLTSFLLAFGWTANNNKSNIVSAIAVGEKICVEGYIMDHFCIDRGTLLDNPRVRTLEGPDRHSVHCLVDVGSCVRSPFEVLFDPTTTSAEDGGDGRYSRGFRLDEMAKNMIVDEARAVGTSCSTCDGGGTLRNGFRAVLEAEILDLNQGRGVPPLITASRIAHSNDLEDPCSLFGMGKMDITEVLANMTAMGLLVDGVLPTTDTNNGKTKLQKQHYIHGALMLTGWGLLLPTGTLFARFFKHRPNGLWYQIHRACQTIGLLLALIGWIVALKNFNVFGDKGYNNRRHGILGMVTMILGLLQPMNAILRPHAPDKGEGPTTLRRVWEVGHKATGYLALMLAVVTIGLGTTILPFLEDQKAFQIAYGAGVGGILFLLFVLVQVDKNHYKDDEDTKREVGEAPQTEQDADDIEERRALSQQ